jgi:hypothetical protein
MNGPAAVVVSAVAGARRGSGSSTSGRVARGCATRRRRWVHKRVHIETLSRTGPPESAVSRCFLAPRPGLEPGTCGLTGLFRHHTTRRLHQKARNGAGKGREQRPAGASATLSSMPEHFQPHAHPRLCRYCHHLVEEEQDSSVICGHGGARMRHAHAQSGCAFWEREPGADDDIEPNPERAFPA